MQIAESIILLIVSLYVVIKSSEYIVGKISKTIGISQKLSMASGFILSTIMVLPEISLGVIFAFRGEGIIFLGNILGSNVTDLLLIIGIFMILRKFNLKEDYIKKMSIYLFPTLFLFSSINLFRHLGLLIGVALLAIYSAYAYNFFRKEKRMINVKIEFGIYDFLFVIISLILLVVSSLFVVISTEQIILYFNIPMILGGAIILGIASTFPEIIMSISSFEKKNPSLATGFVFGSFIITLFVIGSVIIIKPIEITNPTYFSFLNFFTLVGIAMAISLPRIENQFRGGLLFLLVYIFYIGLLLSMA